MTGQPANEHIGRSISEILPRSTIEMIEPLLRKMFETGKPMRGVERIYESLTEPGKIRYALANYYPVGRMAGEAFAIGAVVTDITDQKVVAEQLRRDAEMRELFIGMLGHDLRQPVSSIAFTTATLLQGGGLSETQARAVRRVAAAAHRMSEMITSLVDFTLARSGGGIPITRTSMDMHATCRLVVEEIESAHPGRTISVSVQGDGRGEWDASRIAEMLSNLITNALSYSPPDTRVTVSVTDDGPAVAVSVHNENAGPPIAPEAIGMLFDPFHRGPRGAGALSPKGLGLGLFIVDQIVRAHGGSIAVRSDVESGTTFTVTLPRVPPERPTNDRNVSR
jgi:signal transduction histidine kinase